MQVGFIGLGHLGRAIAERLIECGNPLVVYNRTPAKAEGLYARIMDSPALVADNTDIILLCLYNSAAVQNIFSGKDGLLSSDLTGKIIVDFSTNHFEDVLSFYDICKRAGAQYLEMPVLGSVVPARHGNLTIVAAGDRAAYEKSEPFLNDIGQARFYLETPGLATKMKLINNMVLGTLMAGLAEALAFGEDAGIDKKEVLEILSAGAGGSIILNAKKKKLLEEDFSTHFSNALLYKDLQCVSDLAYSMKKPLFTASMIKDLYARTFEEGIDQEDFSAIYKIFKGRR